MGLFLVGQEIWGWRLLAFRKRESKMSKCHTEVVVLKIIPTKACISEKSVYNPLSLEPNSNKVFLYGLNIKFPAMQIPNKSGEKLSFASFKISSRILHPFKRSPKAVLLLIASEPQLNQPSWLAVGLRVILQAQLPNKQKQMTRCNCAFGCNCS